MTNNKNGCSCACGATIDLLADGKGFVCVVCLKRQRDAARAEVIRWRDTIGSVMPPDCKDWHQNNPDEWPEVTRLTILALRKREESALEMAGRSAEESALDMAMRSAEACAKAEAERDEARRHVNELNTLARRAGWGQGEIDCGATMAEELERAERERDEARKALRDAEESAFRAAAEAFRLGFYLDEYATAEQYARAWKRNVDKGLTAYLAAQSPAPEDPAPPQCVICGNLAHANGCELHGGIGWVCSEKCWEAYAADHPEETFHQIGEVELPSKPDGAARFYPAPQGDPQVVLHLLDYIAALEQRIAKLEAKP